MTAHSRYDDRKSNINGLNRTFWLIEAFMENNMLVVRPSLNEQRRGFIRKSWLQTAWQCLHTLSDSFRNNS